jgi:GNAT superfamily N-acetyltransferase
VLAAAAVTYQRETLSDALWSEVSPLLGAHYAEIAHYQDIALEPNRDAYARLQGNGGLRIYTARTPDWRLIGYLCVVVSTSLHYASHLFASQDVLYVDKAHRGQRTGVDLIRFAHDQLRSEGVSVLFQHVKHRSDINIGPMLGRLLGYEHVDDLWAVRLDQER